ncbi:MAG: YeeE/YedE family protein [Thermoanaerobaculia bacterium]|nr:YeeE/YedE family protein [Thermoanaerobaculia bacterium]
MQPPAERPYWNPYVAGFCLGLVLLGSFLVMGFGLGSSSVPTRLAIGAAHLVAPAATEANAYFSQYVGPGKNVLEDWLVFEVLGIFLGGLVGAYSAGRLKGEVIRGEGVSKGRRIALAIAGGVIMGFAARLARGCTSGQALTGGAVLSLGSWIFMMCVFAGGYLLAPFLKKDWR